MTILHPSPASYCWAIMNGTAFYQWIGELISCLCLCCPCVELVICVLMGTLNICVWSYTYWDSLTASLFLRAITHTHNWVFIKKKKKESPIKAISVLRNRVLPRGFWTAAYPLATSLHTWRIFNLFRYVPSLRTTTFKTWILISRMTLVLTN